VSEFSMKMLSMLVWKYCRADQVKWMHLNGNGFLKKQKRDQLGICEPWVAGPSCLDRSRDEVQVDIVLAKQIERFAYGLQPPFVPENQSKSFFEKCCNCALSKYTTRGIRC
jgi:hypothetical protein